MQEHTYPENTGQPQAASIPQAAPLPVGSNNASGAGEAPQHSSAQDAPPTTAKQGTAAGGRRGLALLAVFLCGFVLLGTLLFAGVQLREAQRLAHARDTGMLPDISLVGTTAGQAMSTIEIVNKVAPSVVSIETYTRGSLEAEGSGSGIIFSQDGYIITNSHVVEGAYAIRAVLLDGSGYTAQLVAQDETHDLAVLKIEAEDLSPAEFGDSEQVQLGEVAIAIGNAAGIFPASPTQGIISGVNRELSMQGSDGGVVTRTLLQTDAAINPGNSGGALVNARGQVIGINVAKLNSTQIDNIGFAIPVHLALPMMQELAYPQQKKIVRPLIGITVRVLNETNGPANGLPDAGLYIETISPDSDLAKHPIAAGDVLIGADGTPVTTLDALEKALLRHKAGETIHLSFYRVSQQDNYEADILLQ